MLWSKHGHYEQRPKCLAFQQSALAFTQRGTSGAARFQIHPAHLSNGTAIAVWYWINVEFQDSEALCHVRSFDPATAIQKSSRRPFTKKQSTICQAHSHGWENQATMMGTGQGGHGPLRR